MSRCQTHLVCICVYIYVCVGAGVRAPGRVRAPVHVLVAAAAVRARRAARGAVPAALRHLAEPDGVLHHVRGVRRQVDRHGLRARALRPRLLLRHVPAAVPVPGRQEDLRLQGVLLQGQRD